jgi:death-on-curing protein
VTRRRASPEPAFLTLDEVLAIHAHQIATYGGRGGIRDIGALESALAMPRATFDGNRLHGTLFEQAAAYLFHVTQNHPFIDGNKRVGLVSALVFLRLNGWSVRSSEDDMVGFVLSVADGSSSKADVATWIKQHAIERP